MDHQKPMNNGQNDSYDEFLEPHAERFLQQIEWVIPLPWMLRFWIGKYIEGLPDASSASHFVARNQADAITNKIRVAYKLAFGREYSMIFGGYSLTHSKWAKAHKNKTANP